MKASDVRAALLLSESKGVSRQVFACLLDHANQSQLLAWPSVSTIMKYTNASERAVQKGLAWLRRHGEIELVEPGGGRRKSSKYRISVFELQRTDRDENPEKTTGILQVENPVNFSRNPAIPARIPAHTAPKRNEQKERARASIDYNPSELLAATAVNEEMRHLLGGKWEPWSTSVVAIREVSGTAVVCVRGEYTRGHIKVEFGDVFIHALMRIIEGVEAVQFVSSSEFNARTETSVFTSLSDTRA